MEQVMNWIKDIFLMILSLTFFEILVPDSEMEKSEADLFADYSFDDLRSCNQVYFRLKII